MADTKISALPATAEVGNADILPIVQGGINFQCTREQILQWKTGEGISLEGENGGRLEISPTGDVDLVAQAGQLLTITFPSGAEITEDIAGLILSIGGFQNLLFGNPTTNARIELSTTADPFIGFTPVNSDWIGVPPDNVVDALQRLISAVVVLNGGPLP